MSFLKTFTDGLSDDLGRLGLGPDKKGNERKEESHASSRDGPSGGQYPGYQGYGQSSPQPYPPPGQSQSPPEAGARPPPPYAPPAGKPPIPTGWTPHWEDYHQRWYCAFT